MSKPISKGLFIVLTLVAGVFMAPSLRFCGSVQATESMAGFSDDANDATSDGFDSSSSVMQSSSGN